MTRFVGPPYGPLDRPVAPPSLRVYRRMLGFARPYAGRLAIAAVLLLGSTAIGLLWPQFVQRIVDGVIAANDPALLDRLVVILVIALAARAGIDSLRAYITGWTGERVIANLRIAVARHLLGLSLSFFNDRKTGELMSHVTNDVTAMHSAVTQSVISITGQLLTLVGAVVIVFATNWRLALVTLTVAPLIALIGVFYGRRVRRMSRSMRQAQGDAMGVLQEAIAEVRTVQAFTREPHETARFRDSIEHMFGQAIRLQRWQATVGPIMLLLLTSGSTIVLWYGGHQVLEGTLTVGQLFAFLLYVGILAAPVGGLAEQWARLQEAFGAADRVFALLDTEAEVRDLPDAVDAPRLSGEIAFERVSFRYGQGPLVLEDVSVGIRAGSVVALVGPSGAGKTTFVNLIGRFYDPTDGRVSVDGRDLRSFTVHSLRAQIAVVPQEPILFAASVRENVRYGRLDATDVEVERAAEAANAVEFVRRLPEGYETLVGERGVKLSVGQRQRIAIARALLRDSSLLLLDEATSSLDNESEFLVQEALERLMRDRTTVVIAHRLTTVERADRILVLEGGRIVEDGTHQELLARGGLYQRLYLRTFARRRVEAPAAT